MNDALYTCTFLSGRDQVWFFYEVARDPTEML